MRNDVMTSCDPWRVSLRRMRAGAAAAAVVLFALAASLHGQAPTPAGGPDSRMQARPPAATARDAVGQTSPKPIVTSEGAPGPARPDDATRAADAAARQERATQAADAAIGQVGTPPATDASIPPSPGEDRGLVLRVPREQFAELRFSNRPIVTFRATIVPSDPRERVDGALRSLTRLAGDGVTGPVSTRRLLGAAVVTVAGRDVFALVPADADAAAGEDLAQLAALTVSRLELALSEAAEVRMPGRLLSAFVRAAGATAILLLLLVSLRRVRRHLSQRLVAAAGAMFARSKVGSDPSLLRASRFSDAAHSGLRIVALGLALLAFDAWLTYVLQLFPYTRPWGERLGGFLLSTLTTLLWSALSALPDLFAAAIILLTVRFAVRLSGRFFDAIEHGRIELAGLSGPLAVPTRRLVTTLLWLFGVIVAYPYLPGSSTEAFKGASVFVGLVVSLGSTGIVNQMASGIMLTYTRALAPGDYVRIGEVEGTVVEVGVVSTEVRTVPNELVTIPNAVVIAGNTLNYSRQAAAGVYLVTAVTIGYDTPWRQVEALLLEAVGRTAGLRRAPAPRVLQTSLSDFYVEYTLHVCIDEPALRVPTLAALHANIQDAFNEHGVQIMSPHYMFDPVGHKVVPRERWFEAPAKRPDA